MYLLMRVICIGFLVFIFLWMFRSIDSPLNLSSSPTLISSFPVSSSEPEDA